METKFQLRFLYICVFQIAEDKLLYGNVDIELMHKREFQA